MMSSLKEKDKDKDKDKESPYEKSITTDFSTILNKSISNHASIIQYPAGNDQEILTLNIFTKVEALELINAAEEVGFGSTHFENTYRGNLRLITFDTHLANKMWDRIKHVFPENLKIGNDDYYRVGLNECMRWSKYPHGTYFTKHVDGNYYNKSQGILSFYTLNIYLNDNFKKGRTNFYLPHNNIIHIVPETGLALIFRQPPTKEYLHEGEKVLDGYKYILRTDVIYKQKEIERHIENIKIINIKKNCTTIANI